MLEPDAPTPYREEELRQALATDPRVSEPELEVKIILHGHAHRGSEWGVTPGGIRVRNVSQPLMRRAYALFTIGEERFDDRLDDAVRPTR